MALASHPIEIPFTKFDAVGNDFLVVRSEVLTAIACRSSWLSRFAQAICDRNSGVGADGLVLVAGPRNPRRDASMRIFNADGSEAEMSGNGVRCAAAFVALEGAGAQFPAHPVTLSLQIETAAGIRHVTARRTADHTWTMRVAMGRPVLDPSRIPCCLDPAKAPVVAFPLATTLGTFPVTITSMGNPHCSLFVDTFDSLDWVALGREIETHRLFPRRTNVEFIRVVSRRQIEVRFWERGVGKTCSSGTGACAAAVACILNRRTGRRLRVLTEKGVLQVDWPEKSGVMLSGSVKLVARGAYYY
jgi:diaminopimelate epimerase